MKNRTYIAIDLKSFYASVECVERGLDPLTTNLVVADIGRTEKTICLAVSPSLKAYGISGRARLFEVVQKVKEVNAERLSAAPRRTFSGASFSDTELKTSPSVSLDYIVAPPRMSHYIDCSTRIYNVYLKYIAPEDIHVYSIDEVFIDATDYLNTYKLSARELATDMILDVLKTTGVTATAGIGTNLYLCKIAMDIQAKHIPADNNGMRIAELDEMSYRRSLWSHRPLTDFWRVGKGYAKKLEDALILSSPEYAGGIPGAFKNALDWLVGEPRFYQKPVAIFAASERSIGAADALRLVLKTMSADVVEGACISLPLTGQTRTPEAILDDPSLKQAIVVALDTLAQHVNAKLGTEKTI
jgi:DNA polymerase V